MSTARSEFRIVLVTPESTLLDEPIEAVRLPLFDGSIGVLPGRAPVVGRLGLGELRITTSGGSTRRYFIEGGFLQVKGPVVSVLTQQAVPVDKIDLAAAEKELAVAFESVAIGDEATAARFRNQERARRKIAIKRSGA
jgi:F-type H+-transporting ATPase subunit epsilon